jgi:hypothetical protein
MTTLKIYICLLLTFVLSSKIFSQEITHVTIGGVVYNIEGMDQVHRNIFLREAQKEAIKANTLTEEKSDEQKRAEAQQRRKQELHSRRFNRTKIAQQKGNARRQAIASRTTNNFYTHSYLTPTYQTFRFYQPDYIFLNWHRTFGELYYGNEMANFYSYGYNATHVFTDRRWGSYNNKRQ